MRIVLHYILNFKKLLILQFDFSFFMLEIFYTILFIYVTVNMKLLIRIISDGCTYLPTRSDKSDKFYLSSIILLELLVIIYNR